ncbi:MAG TPA: methylenetetrahydrofolate reductase [NAD(P)H] [Acidiferrobacterales bacterium]|nr:methylenetetrahydrofolate reductase [NAD(P)H] [Acidiferrobacterales bacterium]
MESHKKIPRTYSCEFFPPKTEQGRANLGVTIDELGRLKPAYFSCTYGAGGSTQDGTTDTVKEILRKGFTAAPHITCIGSTPGKIKALLDGYIALGIKRIVALRGDLPPGQDKAGHFLYADQLVAFIRQQTGDHFHIEIAAYPEKHPQAASIQHDLRHFKKKADAGANAAITQYFFNPDAYFRFVDDCAGLGVTIPVVPGIMPITNYKQLARFSEGCGAEIPRWIAARLEGYGEDLDAIRAFGLEVTLQLCETLLERGAPGLHFYTLNRTEPTRAIWEQLGL